MVALSVVICTHNPRKTNLMRVIDALKVQTLAIDQWEFLLIDNKSITTLAEEYNLSWHPKHRHIREDVLGLTAARFRAIKEAKGESIVFVDDDNLLDPHYLEYTLHILQQHPAIGIAGGKSLPIFESEPPEWLGHFWGSLALRDLGDDTKISTYHNHHTKQAVTYYPDYAPIGAGMIIRRTVALHYVLVASQTTNRQGFGRKGNKLTSGEDNDMVVETIKYGYEVGYFPQLVLQHIIPPGRLEQSYLARLNHASNKSWVQVLSIHGMCPWPKISKYSVAARKLKAYFVHKAWHGEVNYIRWRGACGMYEALAEATNSGQ